MTLELGIPLLRKFTPLPSDSSSGLNSSISTDRDSVPIAREFKIALQEIDQHQQEILQAYTSSQPERMDRSETKKTDKKTVSLNDDSSADFTTTIPISPELYPELVDHSLFPQHEGCDLEDRGPVVPMTMSIQLLKEYLSKRTGGKKVIRIKDVHALRWIPASYQVDMLVKGKQTAENEYFLEIEEHFNARFELADAFPDSPEPSDDTFPDAKPTEVDARTMYDDLYMFHGPLYQGIKELGPACERGIRGILHVPSSKGSHLDSDGQLFGYWILAFSEQDKLALPIGVSKINLFGEDPEPGSVLNCKVWITPDNNI